MAENVIEGHFTEEEPVNDRPKTTALTLPETIQLPAAPRSQNQKSPISALIGAFQGQDQDRRIVEIENKTIRVAYRNQLRQAARTRMAKDTADGLDTLERLTKASPKGSRAADFLKAALEHAAKDAPENFTDDMERFNVDTDRVV